MEPLILALETVQPDDLPRIGGKAAQLWRLQAAGFPVPSAFCLTTDAFRLALAPYRERISLLLSGSDIADAETAQKISDEIWSLLSDWEVPAEVAEAIYNALPMEETSALMAVRSSATAEDRADVSFAGQYETILGVQGKDALLNAILACWRSFFSPHALVARAAAGALGEDEAISLLLQQMIDAECSGVAFSVDPVQPDSGKIVVNAAWGLGTGVVDSQAAADTYRVRRTDLHTDERQITEKLERVVLSPEGEESLEAVSEDRRRAACLPDGWLRRIAQFTLAAEQQLGGPQDIEWAIAGDQVWMLQSRPVTALPPDFTLGTPFPLTDEERSGPLWEINGSSRNRVPLPLDLDVDTIRTAASTETLIINGGSWGDRRDLSLRKVVHGRVYSRSVPSDLHAGDARIRKASSRELGHRLRETNVTPWEHNAPEVMSATKRLSEFDQTADDGPALADHLEDAFGAYRRHWAIHFSMPNGQAFSEPFIEAFARLSGRKKEEAGEAAFPLLEGAGNMLTRLVDGLYALAQAAKGTSAEQLLASGDAGVMKRLEESPDAEPFLKELRAFLAIYGDRSGLGIGSQPALYVPTWRENPELIFPMIAPYFTGTVDAPEALRSRMNVERDRQAEELAASSEDAEVSEVFRRWLPLMRRARTDLENHNHYIDQMSVGQLRGALIAAGQWLVEKHCLAERDDVFWLHREEIDHALRSNASESLQDTLAQRKTRWEEWEKMTPPPVFGLPKPQLEPRKEFKDEVTPAAAEEDGVLRGTGASAEKFADVRVSFLPERSHPDIAPGEILVAEYAGPAWTPLFPTLGGIVLTHAALFHHAATTAREYGLPAVINLKDATQRIPDGCWLTLDGTTGEVFIESEPGEETLHSASPESSN